MYERILVPTDGSALSAAALSHATHVAALSGAELIVIEVVPGPTQATARFAPGSYPFDGGSAVGMLTAEEMVTLQRQEAAAHLEAAAQALRDAGATRVQCEIAEGHPGEAILAAAERLSCDLIVMATHGRTGLRRAILGSVADYVVRHAQQTPVLLVRPPAP